MEGTSKRGVGSRWVIFMGASIRDERVLNTYRGCKGCLFVRFWKMLVCVNIVWLGSLGDGMWFF